MTMPIFILFIATFIVSTALLPERVLHRVRTMRAWLNRRQEKRERENARLDEVDAVMDGLVTRVATTVRQLRDRPNKKEREQLLIQLKAEGERYLKVVDHDDQPSIHHFAKDLIEDVETELNKRCDAAR